MLQQVMLTPLAVAAIERLVLTGRDIPNRTWTSDDAGATWTGRGTSISTSQPLGKNGTLCISLLAGSTSVYRSTNEGETFSAGATGFSNTIWTDVVYNGAEWLGLGLNRVGRSTDGTNFSSVTTSIGVNNGAVFHAGQWVMVGDTTPWVSFSPTGAVWTNAPSPIVYAGSTIGQGFKEIFSDGSRLIAVGSASDGGVAGFGVFYSDNNGVTWTAGTVATTWYALDGPQAYDGSSKVLCCQASDYYYLSTNNGVTFTEYPTPVGISGDPYTDLIFKNGVFVLVTTSGVTLTSADGINWTVGGSVTAGIQDTIKKFK